MGALKDHMMDLCRYAHAAGFAAMFGKDMASMHACLKDAGCEEAADAFLNALSYRLGGKEIAESFLYASLDGITASDGHAKDHNGIEIIMQAYEEGTCDSEDYAECFAVRACNEAGIAVPDILDVPDSLYERLMDDPYSIHMLG